MTQTGICTTRERSSNNSMIRSWFYMGNMAAGEISDKRVFFNETINLGITGTHKIKKGLLEWPFEFELLPSMPESVEGMASSWLVYNLTASVERPGWGQKHLTAREHIRLVRTLALDHTEATRSRVRYEVRAVPAVMGQRTDNTPTRQTQTSGPIRSAIAFPFPQTPLSLEPRSSQMWSCHPLERA